ncbi:multicopper oxidase family protein [Roseovarius faecimaris]|uniref:Multicopper oxidase family protein n=1 Tax=Roseovarius faecimaris TaxID=2494550 RepID=A0A6I6IP91_9RHOB|nr:multicopper oxidase family protein [Roseovarius faecimaris]QGX97621.1 multicopper oxidase family protein [Roseovarius faecimaris]
MLTRRQLLTRAAALPLVAGAGGALASAQARSLTAAATALQIAPPDYPRTPVWAYNGQVPGEQLRYRQGEVLDVRFVNGLDEGSTIHWHGLRLPNAMDGVPYMTQAPVMPGESFDYRFALRDAGTFWYHPHANSVEQISRGLAGVLVVDEATPPDVDRDEVLVLDDWRMTETAEIHPSFGHRHDMSHAGRLGNYVTVNARDDLSYQVRTGERLRLRLVNTATARIFRLALQGMQGWVVALDGMPLPAPQPASELVIAPAQRADLIVDITAADEALIASVERQGTFALVSFAVSGAPLAPRPTPGPLPPNDLPSLDLSAARSYPLVMEGGAMRGLPEGAIWDGRKLGFRELAEQGQFWAFNGIAGSTETPFLSAALGETVRIPITNRTAWFHAMHLHGMHFREVLADGSFGPWRDTLLIAPDESREIAFVADNPGDWMFHCHMPSHQMSGMMNWVQVT